MESIVVPGREKSTSISISREGSSDYIPKDKEPSRSLSPLSDRHKLSRERQSSKHLVEDEDEDEINIEDDGHTRSPPRHQSVNSFLKFSIQNILQATSAVANQQKRALEEAEKEDSEAASEKKIKFDPSSLSIW